MLTMKIDGYMITAEFDGSVLTLHANNAAARAALLGPKSLAKVADHLADKAGDIERRRLTVEGDEVGIPLAAITGVTFKPASMLTNGNLIIETDQGGKYQAHFRKKQGADFEQLAADLNAKIAPSPT